MQICELWLVFTIILIKIYLIKKNLVLSLFFIKKMFHVLLNIYLEKNELIFPKIHFLVILSIFYVIEIRI